LYLQAICVIVAWEIGLMRDEIGGVKTAETPKEVM
jgi:hypothetical protein